MAPPTAVDAPTSAPKTVPTAGQRNLVELLQRQTERRSAFAEVNAAVYASAEHFALEQRHIFRGLPVPIGPTGLLPEPGAAVSHNHYGVPLLLTRDTNGTVRAMANTCRHRGAQLLDSQESVKMSRISCPYHAWTYQLDGRLAAIPFPKTFACLEKEDYGLVTFPAYEAGGMIWAKLDPTADHDFTSVEPELVNDFDALGFPGMHLYKRRTHVVDANWKFVVDGFQELYHVKVLHANSVADMFANAVTTDISIGHHMRFATARKDYEKLDVNGDLDDYQRFITFSYLIFPNTIVVVSPTFTNILVSYPQTVGTTLIDDYMLTPKLPETEAEHRRWESSWQLLDGTVYEREDLYAAELQQKGLQSGMLQSVVLGGLEMPIRTFHDNLERYLPQH